jgi:halocyanin-like protein
MSSPNVDSSRRRFLRTAAGTATAAAATGTAAAASEDGGGGGGGGGAGGGTPDVGGYLQGANNYSGDVEDLRGQDEVTIQVGAGDGLAFGPAAVWVDPGTTIVWEWTGNGGAHNVISDNVSAVDSGSPVGEAGTTYEFTPEESQIIEYYCSPHESSGMLGAVAVGSDIPMNQPSSGSSGPPLVPDNAKVLGIASSFAMASTLGLAYLFIRYGGDYEGSP